MHLRRSLVGAALGILVVVAGVPALAAEGGEEGEASGADVASAAAAELLGLKLSTTERDDVAEALKVLSQDLQTPAPPAAENGDVQRIGPLVATPCRNPPDCGLMEYNVEEARLRASQPVYVPRTRPLTFGEKAQGFWNDALAPFYQLHSFLTVGQRLERQRVEMDQLYGKPRP